uniref:EGF-like domain-containing protein n=1 Tax=Parascaris univalens TaxID=6257 RepID=A0A915A1S6_PARUN
MRGDRMKMTCEQRIKRVLDRNKCWSRLIAFQNVYICQCSVVYNMEGAKCESKVHCTLKAIRANSSYFNFDVACESSASKQISVAPERPKHSDKGYKRYAPQSGHSKSAYTQEQGQKAGAPKTQKKSYDGEPQNTLFPANWRYEHNQEHPSRKMGNAKEWEASPHGSARKNVQEHELVQSEKITPIPTHLVVQTLPSANTETMQKASTLAKALVQSFPPNTEDVEEYPKKQMATSPYIWSSGKCITCEGHCLSTVTIAIILGPCVVLVLGFGVGIGFLIARIWPDNLKLISVAPPPLPPNRSEAEKSVVTETIEPPMETQTVTSQVGSTVQGNTTTTTATKFTKHFEICNRPPKTICSRKVPLQSIVEGITHTCTTTDAAKDKTVLDNP